MRLLKGYEYEEGQYAIITKEDFVATNVKQTKMLETVTFLDSNSIVPIYFEKIYYHEPDKGREK
jgi:DNA end-binding protein Ku